MTEDIKVAMKAKDKVRLETVRSIKKLILEEEANARAAGKDSLTETQEMDILTRLAKQRRDSIEQYTKAGRQELADGEAAELAILEEYLPKQLSDEDIAQVVDEIIAQVGANSPKDMGKVMGPAMQKLKGKADGKKVQEAVKARLNS
ncbi:MAG: GatB/YqeY domain-containing protein [Okeania sp. SIO2D1]|nr:GatB/YqeY domain-containing protein [Okeania sp. SIO2D1]